MQTPPTRTSLGCLRPKPETVALNVRTLFAQVSERRYATTDESETHSWLQGPTLAGGERLTAQEVFEMLFDASVTDKARPEQLCKSCGQDPAGGLSQATGMRATLASPLTSNNAGHTNASDLTTDAAQHPALSPDYDLFFSIDGGMPRCRRRSRHRLLFQSIQAVLARFTDNPPPGGRRELSLSLGIQSSVSSSKTSSRTSVSRGVGSAATPMITRPACMPLTLSIAPAFPQPPCSASLSPWRRALWPSGEGLTSTSASSVKSGSRR